MAEENNQKLQYLKRDDVRTMEKDIARLREGEAERTREKIAQIQTGEEVRIEAQRLERAKEEAEAKERMEAEAEKREEELIKSKEEREAAATLEQTKAINEEEQEKERLRAQFREAQLKEEAERKKFLESVAEKSGEPILEEEKPIPIPPQPTPPPLPQRPVPPPAPPKPTPPPIPEKPAPFIPPLPPKLEPPKPQITPPEPRIAPQAPVVAPPLPPAPKIPTPPLPVEVPKKKFQFSFPKIRLPQIRLPKREPKPEKPKAPEHKFSVPKVKLPKIQGYFPAQPSILSKIWIRVVISLFILAVLATLITFWYWYLTVRQIPEPAVSATQQVTVNNEPEIIQRLLNSGYYTPTAPRAIDTVIIHSGSNSSGTDPYSMDGIIQEYKKAGVATHYLIGRNGEIFQLAPDDAIAYHAGAGKMPDGRTSVNNFSLGISLVYRENESPNELQYQSLSWLIKRLQNQYNITLENIFGYKDVAPTKTTPWNFDWEKLKLLFSLSFSSPSTGAEFFSAKTLEEKIGQLFIVGFEGASMTPQLEAFMKAVKPGGVILFGKNIETALRVKKLIQDLQNISLAETGLPLLIAIDQEGGVVSRAGFLQEKTGQADATNTDQAYQIGFRRGKELKELGVNLNLAPILDLTQPGDFLHQRSFQKNLEETGILAKALVSGQKAAGILTAVKHFPGYGGISSNPEATLTAMSAVPETRQFGKAMEAEPELVMLASVVYSSIDKGKPIAFSKKGISILKQELGGTALVITDDLLQPAFTENFSLEEIVSLPIAAGADVLLFSSWQQGALTALAESVRNGTISAQLIDQAVSKIIALKRSL